MSKALLIASALLLLQSLTGCGRESVKIEYVPVPERWLSCAVEPAVPAGNTDKEVAGYIVDLLTAGADCRSKVTAIRDWSLGQKVTTPR